MKKFEGKRLLVLGTSVGSVDIVKYAKEEGAFVLVTDYLPTERSLAKQFADKTSMISTLDVPALCELARENNIDGVICGVSEANIESTRQVCEQLGLPIYYTSKQWDVFMNKASFRNLCSKYRVNVPNTYFTGSADQFKILRDSLSIKFPVIVKPVDSGANIGISICYSMSDLLNAVEFAVEKSDSGNIIVEQFVNGIEVCATYVIQNGRCRLVCMGSKYAYENENGLKALSHAYVYPAPYMNEYLEKMDESVKNMILSQGLDNCTIFFQGIYADNNFYIFESGLRMEGTASFRITKRMNGCSFMEFLTDNALGVKTNYDIECEDPSFAGRKCVIFSQICKGGFIGKIEGFDEAINNSMIISSEQRYFEGDYVANDGTLKQIMFRYVIQDDDMEKVVDMIKYIQNTVKAYDKEGNYLLVEGFDANILL